MMKKLRVLLIFVLLYGMIALSTPTVVVADDDPPSGNNTIFQDDNEEDKEDETDTDDDGVNDEKESAYEREVQMESEEYKFKIQSELKNGTNKDKFEIGFDVGESDDAELKLHFESESGNNETALEFKVKFDEIIEFIDEGADGYGNETILSKYEIGKSGWSPLEITQNATSGMISINATTLDGVFTLMMRMASNFLVNENVTLSPNSIKIDVLINDFAYNSTGSKLAVKGQMKTEHEVEIDDVSEDEVEGIAHDEAEVNVNSTSASGFFSWAETADVDGTVVSVITSSLADSSDEEGETSSKMYFTFNATDATNINWDPKLGVVSAAAKENYKLAVPIVDTTTSTSISQTDSVTSDAAIIEQTTQGSLHGFEMWMILPLLGIASILSIRRRN